MKTVLLIQTVVPDYRKGVLELLVSRFQGRLAIVAGSDYFYSTLRTDSRNSQVERVSNQYMAGRRLLWQSGVFRRALHADAVIAELNPRILSTWGVLIARKLLRRPTILWGHAWPRRGSGSWTDQLRQLQRRLASGIVVYTRADADALRTRMSRIPIFVAPNAIYRKDEIRPATATVEPTQFVYSGRLVAQKKPGLLLEAFSLAVKAMPPQVRLVFVGDGPLREPLMQRTQDLNLGDRVVFLGHVVPTLLGSIYDGAIAAVSPGYVGLSLTQALAHGVPMLIARDEPHAPEIEAAQAGFNAEFFESDAPEALAASLVAACERRMEWRARAAEIAAECTESYSVESMANGLIEAIDHASEHG